MTKKIYIKTKEYKAGDKKAISMRQLKYIKILITEDNVINWDFQRTMLSLRSFSRKNGIKIIKNLREGNIIEIKN